MSLRRPYRDSWDQREYKRVARSHSPPAERPTWTPIRRETPSEISETTSSVSSLPFPPDPRHYTMYSSPTVEDLSDSDEDDDYPERLALTPSPPPPEEVAPESSPTEPVLQDSDDLISPRSSAMHSSILVDSSQGEEDIDLFSNLAQVHTPGPNQGPPTLEPSTLRSTSDTSTIYPEDSASQVRSNFTNTTSSTTTQHPTSNQNPLLESQETTEHALLHSPFFPTHLLRPVPDLPTLLVQTAPVLGDPGSGHVKFGAPSPQKATFEDPADTHRRRMEEYFAPRVPQSVLREGTIATSGMRRDYLGWMKKPVPVASQVGGSRDSKLSGKSRHTPPSMLSYAPSTGFAAPSYKTRQYSISPTTRTRNLSINLLERRITHGELLALNLSPDARRDAIAIGGTTSDVGGSLLTGTGRGASQNGLATDATAMSIGGSRGSSGTGSSNPLGNNNSNSNSASPSHTLRHTRSRESVRNSSMSTSSGSQGYLRPTSSSHHSHNPTRSTSPTPDYDPKSRRYRAADVSSTMETGRYGIGGMCLWRLVRVGAVVGGMGEGEAEEHVAWWVVPERACGGYF